MVEFERGGQVEPCAGRYYCSVARVCLRKTRREVDAGPARPGGADGAHNNSFLICWSADGDPVTYSETVHASDFDVGCACARVSREIRAIRLGADARHRDGLGAMAGAVDVQPDVVIDRNVGNRRDLDVGRASGRILRQVGLRTRLAHRPVTQVPAGRRPPTRSGFPGQPHPRGRP